jgi:hypothetical protein
LQSFAAALEVIKSGRSFSRLLQRFGAQLGSSFAVDNRSPTSFWFALRNDQA